MTQSTHHAAPPGSLYWRKEICPHAGSKVLLLTIGGVCVVGQWYGPLGHSFTAWCPLPKEGAPPAQIQDAPLLARIKFAVKLIFQPLKSNL